jgi:hypothetical protein
MKKLLLLLCLSQFLTNFVIAGEPKHQPQDIDLGINLEVNFMLGFSEEWEYYQYMGAEFGASIDYYFFNWLSVSSGLTVETGGLLWEDHYDTLNSSVGGGAPLYMQIPLAFHINIPKIDWLYVGGGLRGNFVLTDLNTEEEFMGHKINTDLPPVGYLNYFADIGFDWMKPNRGGSRFFFRISQGILAFSEDGVYPKLIDIGILYQYNFKIK